MALMVPRDQNKSLPPVPPKNGNSSAGSSGTFCWDVSGSGGVQTSGTPRLSECLSSVTSLFVFFFGGPLVLIKKAGRASQLLGSNSTLELLSRSVGPPLLLRKIKSRRGRRAEKCDGVSGLFRGCRCFRCSSDETNKSEKREDEEFGEVWKKHRCNTDPSLFFMSCLTLAFHQVTDAEWWTLMMWWLWMWFVEVYFFYFVADETKQIKWEIDGK